MSRSGSLSCPLIDTHCHLADTSFDEDRTAVLARALEAGVDRIVAVGGGGPIEASEQSARLARGQTNIRATAGIHPHDASSYDDDIEKKIEALLDEVEVVAVGETGLDYHYDHSPREVQRDALRRQLALAERRALPIVLHCRSAERDLIDILRDRGHPPLRGVVHCFTGDYDAAKSYLDLGLLVSVTGILTFDKAEDLRKTVARLPLDRLMVETDAPYLAPVPHRGKRNEPAFVREVASVLAQLFDVDLEEVAETTTRNACSLFFDTDRSQSLLRQSEQ